MGEELHLGYFLLRYVPTITKEDFLTIGLLMFVRELPDFAGVRFLDDWTTVLSIDPDADLDYLQTFAKNVETQIRKHEYRKQLLELMNDSFSNSIQLSGPKECLAANPIAEFGALCSVHLRGKHYSA